MCPGQVTGLVEYRMKTFADVTKGFDDTRFDTFSSSGGVTHFLVAFTATRRKARTGKGCDCIPLGKRIAYRRVKEVLFSRRGETDHIHNGINRVS